jgi:hypothetical protein
MVLALLKLGLSLPEILRLPVAEANSLLEVYDEIVNPDQPKKYVVKKRP